MRRGEVASAMRLPVRLSPAPARTCRRGFSAAVVPACAAMALSAAALSPAARPEPPQFVSSVDLVEVYATVTGSDGTVAAGLTSADFEVFEDGRPQTIQAFAAGDFPLSLALAIDHSASMAGSRLRAAAGAARRLLGRLRPEDQVMIVGVSSDVTVRAPLSADRAAQSRAIATLAPWSATSLHDAIIASIAMIQPARGRRGLIILSDGEDRYSNAGPREVLDRARRSDVLVYPVAVGPRAPEIFAEVAALTGGRSFHARDDKAIDRALAGIAAELRAQYLLGYAPARDAEATSEPGWRSIEVRIRRDGFKVRARGGYLGR
jgi:Ca-activated chloride channel homolog